MRCGEASHLVRRLDRIAAQRDLDVGATEPTPQIVGDATLVVVATVLGQEMANGHGESGAQGEDGHVKVPEKYQNRTPNIATKPF
jgi:hypothetical protein